MPQRCVRTPSRWAWCGTRERSCTSGTSAASHRSMYVRLRGCLFYLSASAGDAAILSVFSSHPLFLPFFLVFHFTSVACEGDKQTGNGNLGAKGRMTELLSRRPEALVQSPACVKWSACCLGLQLFSGGCRALCGNVFWIGKRRVVSVVSLCFRDLRGCWQSSS